MMDFLSAHWLDIVTTVLGLAYILLEYKASIWMWLVGFFMQALGIVLYYQKGLYADCGMEFYYLSMTIYGYWRWVRGTATKEPLPIRHFPPYSGRMGHHVLVSQDFYRLHRANDRQFYHSSLHCRNMGTRS